MTVTAENWRTYASLCALHLHSAVSNKLLSQLIFIAFVVKVEAV